MGAPPTSAAATKPRTVGRYLLFDDIAAGGMATVHLARLMGPVGFTRTVAVKQMHAHLANDAKARSMFIDEARMASRVRHPNVVAVLDVVADERDLLLVMDYVHGESLARLVKARPESSRDFPVRIASAILIGVLHGLHAAHEAKDERGEPLGLVHRDVSPQNVLVGLDGVPRVVDFGIAKAAGRIQNTTDGQLKGKAAYLAPEQILDGVVDRRTDVYAASVVLWELLTGRRLFDGRLAASTLRQVLSPTYEPPSRHAAAVPVELDRVVMRGLSRDPAARFATAWEMATALESVAPPASVRELSEWVEGVVGEVLRARAKRVAAIESASTADVSSTDVPSSDELRSRTAPDEETETRIEPLSATPSDAPSDASHAGLAVSPPASSAFARRRRFAVAGIVLGALSLGGFGVVRACRADAPRSAAPAVAASPSPPSSPSLDAPIAVAPPPAISAGATSSAGTVAAAPAGARAAPTAPSGPARAKATKRSATSAPSRSCAVPFTWAPDGTKIPKPECL